eukprot:GGOE01004668.1.p1 GENE.GGOE01004668.1~~GGOE01004668.1.p1  ORF type:complete len:117 (-),score=0.37 GGOE01004668.1:54-404(-)
MRLLANGFGPAVVDPQGEASCVQQPRKSEAIASCNTESSATLTMGAEGGGGDGDGKVGHRAGAEGAGSENGGTEGHREGEGEGEGRKRTPKDRQEERAVRGLAAHDGDDAWGPWCV